MIPIELRYKAIALVRCTEEEFKEYRREHASKFTYTSARPEGGEYLIKLGLRSPTNYFGPVREIIFVLTDYKIS